MELNGAALNVNKPCMTSQKMDFCQRLHEKELLLPGKFSAVENEILHNVEEGINFEFWDAHVLELVVKIYIRIKIRYICKRISEVEVHIRHRSTKAVTLKHQ